MMGSGPEHEAFLKSFVERAWEPPEEVVITRALAESPDLDYDDFGVLVRLLLRDPRQPTSVPELMAEFQASGWSVGEKPLRRIMGRLKKAGHVSHKREYNPKSQRPEWVFRVFRNPANNPQYTDEGIAALSQVRPIGPNQPDREPGPLSDRAESAVFAGQADRADSARSAPIGPNRPDRKADVSAGQADPAETARSEAPPPHPPEEEDSSSPYPLTRTTGPLPSQRDDAADAAEVAAAVDFLQQMRKWSAGLATARKCAPRLVRTMRLQGWPLLASMDDVQRTELEAEILKNTGGAASWVKCLPGWCEDLRRYRKAPAAPAAGLVQGSGQHLAALRAACPACDPLGWVLDDDDDKPNRRCAHPGVTVDIAGGQP